MANSCETMPSTPTIETVEWNVGLEYSGRAEEIAPASMRKEIGLPATDRVSQGSVLLIMVGPYVVPGHRQSAAANPGRYGSSKPGVCSEWGTDSPLP